MKSTTTTTTKCAAPPKARAKTAPLPPTPYAVLLAKPTDDDAVIRKLFHALAQSEDAGHPDRLGAGGEPGPRWYEVSQAYAQIKTEGLRQAWERRNAVLARLCKDCNGWGVVGTRFLGGKVSVCVKCGGAGRA